MRPVLIAIVAALLVVGEADATTYHVSPSGSDAADGLSEGSAWLNLDRGDRMGVLVPGDTVFVHPGTYYPTTTPALTTPGTALQPVVYVCSSDSAAVMNGGNQSFEAVRIEASNVVLVGLEITNYHSTAVLITGDTVTVSSCYLHEFNNTGIELEGVNATLVGNAITGCGDKGIMINKLSDPCRVDSNRIEMNKVGIDLDASDVSLVGNLVIRNDNQGIKIENDGERCHVYNNTVYGNGDNGIDIDDGVLAARIINNIVVRNKRGIHAKIENLAAYNLVWDNTDAEYDHGIVDSSGGISADPLFADTTAGDFTLLEGSPAINAGMDLGYPYLGSAPDIGAVEYQPPNTAPSLQPVSDTSIAENEMLAVIISATDSNDTAPGLAAENLPLNATFVDSANGAGLFTFAPDFDQSGDYTVRFIASDGELADSIEFTISVENVNRSPVLAAIGDQSVEEGQVLSLNLSATDPDGDALELTAMPMPINATFTDNGDGTASFDFIPSYSQAGSYQVRFSASDGLVSDSERVTITVTPAPISRIEIIPDSAVVEVFDSVQFSAFGYDAGNVLVGTVTDSVTWSTTDPAGSIGPSGLYMAGDQVSPPYYLVQATYQGLYVDTAEVRVISDGSLHHLQIEWFDGTPVGDTTLTTDNDGLTLYCRGYDIGNTLLGDVSVSWCWVSGGTTGTISPSNGTSTTLTLTTPGADRIAVNCALAMTDTTGTITVTAGLPSAFSIVPSTATVAIDSTIDFAAQTLDADGNLANPQLMAEWTVLNGVGIIDSLGLFTPVTIGDGYVVASSGGEAVPVCPPNMAHYWAFNKGDGPPFTDWSGSDDADCVDCPAYIAGRAGMALDFNGEVPGEFIQAPSSDGLTNQLTAMAWVRLDGVSLFRDAGIVGRADGFELVVDALTSHLSLTLHNGGSTQVITQGLLDPGIATLTWVHVAATYNGATATIYLNGDPVASETADFAALGSGTNPYTIGWTSGSNFLNGRIDEVAVYDRALSTIDIRHAYQDGEVHASLCETVVLGLADTTDVIRVTAGALASIEAEPDSVSVSSDSTVQYSVSGYDSHGNPCDAGTISYSLTAPIGTIDAAGLFEATTVGTARVIAESDLGAVDTTSWLEVRPGGLHSLSISPSSVAVRIGDSVQFTVTGYDADSNIADAGTIDWRAIGRIGTIDSTGLFIATAAGKGQVLAASSLNGVADTSGYVDVDEIAVTPIAIGTSSVRPGARRAPLLSLSIDNYFAGSKSISSITVRDATRGPGSEAERLTNIDSLAVYLDTDHDSLLTSSDSLLARAPHGAVTTTLSFSPLTVAADSHVVLHVGAVVHLFARDSDSLDLYTRPAGDLVVVDGTIPQAADSVNSLGMAVVDGMIAAQLRHTAIAPSVLEPADTIYQIMAVDIPRNGYQADTLRMFSLASQGTARTSDFDSLTLYRDQGSVGWDQAVNEAYVGRLYFTGDRWTATGLHVPLTATNTRFYVGANLSSFPTNGATIIPYIPLDGLQMSSGNDGPIDQATTAIDTFAISSFEAVAAEPVQLAGGELIPGEISDALLATRLTNTYASSVSVDSVEFALVALDLGGATQGQLDSQIDSVLLYITRSDGNTDMLDSLVTTGLVSSGTVRFATPGLQISGNGGALTMSVAAAIDLRTAKNGNRIGFRIVSAGKIWCASGATVAGSFPIVNNKAWTVNAFPLAAVTVHPVAGRSLFGGQLDQMVMDFELPRNGYSSDLLSQVRVTNRGQFNDVDGLTDLKLWADNGSGSFSTTGSILVGEGKWDGLDWVVSASSYPLTATTTRFYVTVSIGADDLGGGTLDLAVPASGITYGSGTTGADDGVIANPEPHVVFQSNRVTAIALPEASASVAPGETDVIMLTMALYNGYIGRPQTMRSVTMSNRTLTRSDQDFADGELGQVRLYLDSDRNRHFSDDSLVATGSFANGLLHLSGVDVILPPESLTYFFAVVDIPDYTIDVDSLAISVDNPSDFGFATPVVINGEFPLVNGGYHVIDGSVRSQYSALPLDARTLRPGDSLVPVFAFAPALNGDQTDTLNSLVFQNLAAAADSDFDRLSVWMDADGDSTWSLADTLLGELAGTAGTWNLSGINLPISGRAPVIFVLCDVALLATPGAALQLYIPINGCQYTSANDGPRNVAVIGGNKFVVSTSGLRISNVPVDPTYTVGQSIAITTTVTNVLSVPMDSVFGVSEVNGPAVLDSAISGPISLLPNEEATFVFYYTAQDTGTASWDLSAYESTLPDSSAVVRTAEVLLQAPAAGVPLHLVNSIPTAVTKGQTNVFPLSLGIQHPDSSTTTASIELDSLTITVVDGSGQPLNASSAFSRMVLSSGYTTLAAIESVPAQSAVTFVFTQPIIVDPGESRLLSMLVDIDDSALSGEFALRLQSPSSVPLFDYNTGLPVTLSPGLTFPISTASCRIDDPSSQLAVSYRSLAPATMNFGQGNVPLLQLIVRHPGTPSSSQIQLSAVSISLVDQSLALVNVQDVCTRVRLIRGQTVIGEAYGTSLDTDKVSIMLVSPVTISPGEIDSVRVVIDAAGSAAVASLALQIADSTQLVARDLSSGAPLTAVSDDAPLATAETGFPMLSSLSSFRQSAVAPDVCLSSSASSSVIAGKDSLAILDILLRYPVGSEYSSQRLTSVATRITDSNGIALDPNVLFDRIGVSLAAGQVTYLSAVQLTGAYTIFTLPDSGLTILPGDSVQIRLVADIESDAPAGDFVVRVDNPTDVHLYDVSDTTNQTGVEIDLGCGSSIPYVSPAIRILQPAGRPTLASSGNPVLLVYRGQQQVTLFSGSVAYSGASSQGDIDVHGVEASLLFRDGAGYHDATAATLFDAVYLKIGDSLVATDSGLTANSIALDIVSGYTVSAGDDLSLTLLGDLRVDAPLGNYMISFPDSTFVSMTDQNLATTIYPLLAQAGYPVLGTEISVTAGGLEESFTNYPNPFHAGVGEATTIGYVLPAAGRVTIEIFTITGAKVIDLVEDQYRTAGSHTDDIWDGRNGEGIDVVPGTYFCRITVDYDTGGTETYRRKVAVLR